MRSAVLVVVGVALAVWVGYETLLAPGDKSSKVAAGSESDLGPGADVKEIPVQPGGGSPSISSPIDEVDLLSNREKAATSAPTPATVGPETSKSGTSAEVSRTKLEGSSLKSDAVADRNPASTSNRSGTSGSSLNDPSTRAWEATRALLESGRPLEAMETLSRYLSRLPGGSDRRTLRARLDRIVSERFFSRAKMERGMFVHTMARGQTLDGLCRQWGREKGFAIAAGMVCKTNGISDPRRIRAGQRIKVISLPLRIEVAKRHYRLVVYLGGVAVKEYGVGLGKNDSTPLGDFVIKTKQIDPTWTWEGKSYPAGDPANILGTRWMGFENRDDLFGYGIHGTTAPESIGKDESNGCVRMRNEEVEELFEWVPRGTKVKIY